MNGATPPSFLAMGGYAAYVWPAYGMFVIVLLLDWLAPQRRRRRLLRALRTRMSRQSARVCAPFSLRGESVASAPSPRQERAGEEPGLP